jgi:hypothetical protein
MENLLRHQVTSVYRRRYCVHVDRIVMDKRNGQQVPSAQRPCISLCYKTARNCAE